MKIGPDENSKWPKLEEEIADKYRRLIFVHRDIIADEAASPKIIPGIYHKIIPEKGEYIYPWREQVRASSPAEEAIKDKELAEMIKNDVVEESNSPFCNNIVMVKKKIPALLRPTRGWQMLMYTIYWPAALKHGGR